MKKHFYPRNKNVVSTEIRSKFIIMCIAKKVSSRG